MKIYRHKNLPNLGPAAERQVVDEFRRIEQFSLETVQYLAKVAHAEGTCQGLDGWLPVWSCDGDAFTFQPSAFYFDGVSTTVTHPLTFTNFDGYLAGVLGYTATDRMVYAGSADPASWGDPATRRPVTFGGSDVLIDAGTWMRMRLPGVGPNDYGYDLHLSADGESVLAIANPQPGYRAVETLQSTAPLDQATWTEITGLRHTVTEDLTAGGLFLAELQLHVWETMGRPGDLFLAVTINGAVPTEALGDIPISAGYTGLVTVNLSETLAVDRPVGTTVNVWYYVQSSPTMDLRLTAGDHRFVVTVNYGGGTGTPDVPPHNQLDALNQLSGGHQAWAINYDHTQDPVTSQPEVQSALVAHGQQIDANRVLSEANDARLDAHVGIGGAAQHPVFATTVAGFVPAPGSGAANSGYYLAGNGTWQQAAQAQPVPLFGRGHAYLNSNYDPASNQTGFFNLTSTSFLGGQGGLNTVRNNGTLAFINLTGKTIYATAHVHLTLNLNPNFSNALTFETVAYLRFWNMAQGAVFNLGEFYQKLDGYAKKDQISLSFSAPGVVFNGQYIVPQLKWVRTNGTAINQPIRINPVHFWIECVAQ